MIRKYRYIIYSRSLIIKRSFVAIVMLCIITSISNLSAQNLLTNPGFENGTTDWGTSGAASVSTSNSACGNNHALMGDGGAFIQNYFSANESCDYTLTFQAERLNIGSGWAGVAISAVDIDNGWTVLLTNDIIITAAGWNTYTLTITTPANTDVLDLWMGTGSGGSFKVDCLVLTENCSSGGNTSSCTSTLINNPEFENNLTNWGHTGNVSTSSDSYIGSTAAHITSGNGGLWQNIATTPGQSHSVTAYAKRIGNNEDATIGLDYYDSNNNWLNGYYTTITSTNYEAHYVSGTAPPNTASVNVAAWKHAGTDEVFVDDICIENWNLTQPTCNNNSCDIQPSYNNYVFAIDDVGDLTYWMDYDNSDLILCDNGDGTMAIKGNIINGRDAEFGSSYNAPCGSQDGWIVDIDIFDKQTWSEFQGSYEVNSSCPDAYLDLDYYDCSGTLTGTGCNSGRTLTIVSPAIGYRLQIGDGGNSHNCGFGMSTWFYITENGNQINADIYANLNESCYTALTTTSNCPINISALGSCGAESLELRLNGTTVATYSLSTSFQTFTYSGYNGTDAISVYFQDGNNGCDFNARIDYIEVSGYNYQTETDGTHSNTTCNSGEWLWCTGTIDFGTLGNCGVEICDDYIDNDGDGDIDCDDSYCQSIVLSSPVVSSCIDHPLRDVATVTLDVTWSNGPSGDDIEVVLGDKIETIFVSSGATSPQTVTFMTTANGYSNNYLEARWKNNTAYCNANTTFDLPSSCSNDLIACNVLYLCGAEKPYDGDPWDHGIINYIDEVNGSYILDAIFTKNDASGMGTYNVNNQNTFINVVLNDYDLIIVSATTENNIAPDLVDVLKNFSGSILNSNFKLIDDLGLSNYGGSFSYQTHAYTDNTTQEEIYNFDNINPSYNYVFTHGVYTTQGDGYLYADANNQSTRNNSILFHYDATDNLPGITGGHGSRTFLGYHMNGIYANPVNGGALPAPTSSYFSPEKHLTLIGKEMFDLALVSAGSGCNLVEICDNGIDDDGDGLIDCDDPYCGAPTSVEAGPAKSLCTGSSIPNVILEGSASGGTSSLTYAWTPTTGLDNPNIPMPAASPTTTTTYTLTVTGDNGCTSTDDVTVSVTSLPTASASGETICSGESATLLSTISGGSGSLSYQWQISTNGNNGWSDITGATNATYTTPTLIATSYYRLVVSTTGGECNDVITNTAAVTIELPSITITADSDPEQLCSAGAVTLTVNEDIASGDMIDYSGWTVGTGRSGDFTVNGSNAENHRIIDTDPWGNSTVVWEARPDATSNADGGWNTALFPIDHTKMYRVSVWVNRKVVGNIGRFYLGTRGYGSTNGLERITNGTTTTNPYFWYSATPPTTLQEDEWVLVVGHIYPSSHTGTTNHTDSGRYTTSDGKVANIHYDYKFLPGTTTAMHRSYLYYCTDVSVRQQWVYPRFDIVDGTEPSIDDLLSGFDVNGGLGQGATWEWYEGSCGGTPVGTGSSITVNPTSTTTYYVRAEGDCNTTACQSVTVSVSDNFSVDLGYGQEICYDESANITANITGGQSPFSYSWEGPEDYTSTTQVISVTGEGAYTVTVTDDNGCSTTDIVTLQIKDTEPGEIGNTTVDCPQNNPATIVSIQDASFCNYIKNHQVINGLDDWHICSVQSVTDPVTGAVDTNSVLSGKNSAFIDMNQVTANDWHHQVLFRNNTIIAGETYNISFMAKATGPKPVRVMLQLGGAPYTNYYSETVNLTTTTNNYSITYTATESSDNINLSFNVGSNLEDLWLDNIVFVSNSCAEPSIDYQWESRESDGNGGWTAWTTIPGATSSTYDPPVLNNTTQYRRLSSVTGCDDYSPTNIIQVDTCPCEVVASATGDTICSGQTATLISNVSGGTGTASYQWQQSTDGSSSWTDISGANSSDYTTPILMATSYYRLVVTYSGPGCPVVITDVATVTVNELPAASAVNNGPITCENTSVTLTASPAGATYLWSNGDSNQSQNVTTSGTYTVTITDNNGCSATAESIVTENTTGPVVDAGEQQAICAGENIELNPNVKIGYNSSSFSYINSTAAYAGPEYLFNNIDDIYGYTFHARRNVSGQDWGISYDLGQLHTVIDLALDRRNDCCTNRAEGGVFQVFNNGSMVYQSDIVNGPGNDEIFASPAPNIIGDEIRYIFLNGANSAQGDHWLNFSELSIYVEGNTYQWTPTTGLSDPDIANPIANPTATINYTLTVTGENGCTSTDDVIVTVNDLPITDATNDGPLTCSQTTVTVTATPAGINYMWADGSTTQSIDVTSTGTYTVTVTDNNGCTATAESIVTENTTPTPIFCERYRVRENNVWSSWMTFDGNCTIEFCEGDGLSDFQFDGGPNINTGWVWTDESGNIDPEVDELVVFPNLKVSDSGTYTGTLTDENGCISTLSYDVIVYPNPIAEAGDDVVVCNGSSISLTASGGDTYLWNDNAGSTTPTITVSPSVTTTYTVTVTNSNGCSSIDSVLVTAASISADIGTEQEICDGSTANIDLIVTGGNSPYSYDWKGPNDFSANTEDISVTEEGAYSVTVTDNNGCTSSDMVAIQVMDVEPGQINDTTIDCPDNDPATITSLESPSFCNYIKNHEAIDNIDDWHVCSHSSITNPITATLDENYELSGKNSAYLEITENTGVRWHHQLIFFDNEIIEGETYTISFEAKATGTKNVRVLLQVNEEPWDIYFSETVTVGTTANTYTLTTTATSSVDNLRLLFDLGENGENIWMDNIVLKNNSCSEPNFDYKWECRESDGNGGWTAWTEIPGATSATYDPPIQTKTKQYRRLSSAENCNDYTESNTVQVNLCPCIVEVSATGETICSGESATVIGTSTGGQGTTSYQWQRSEGGTIWTDISGANSINYTTPALSASTYYRIQASYTGEGCDTVYSEGALVEVELQSIPVSIIAEPESICTNESTTLTINENIITGGLIDYSSWTIGTGNTGKFSVNGANTENHRITGTDPWGNSTVVWEARPDATSTADGGWNTARINIDHTKMYRVSVWVNRKVVGNIGRFYLGTRGYGSTDGLERITNGTITTNPYFWYSATPPTTLQEDEWVLVVGHIYPSSHTGTTNHTDSGRYTTLDGKVANIHYDYKFLPGTTTAIHRSYLYYCTDVSVRQQWVYPRFDIVDGTEPSIDDLLSGFDVNGGLGQGATWVWYEDSCGGTPIGTGTSITVNPSATTTYYVRGEGDCGNSDCQSITVTVNTPPSTTATNDGPLTCDQTNVILTATPTGMTYLWSDGSTQENNTISVAGEYTVTVTDSNGCTASATTVVTENLVAPVAEAGDNITICLGASFDLTATGGSDYIWDDTAASTTATINVSPNVTTTYTVTVTDTNGCSATDEVVVTVTDAPAQITLPESNCADLSSIYEAHATEGASYLWDFAGVTTADGDYDDIIEEVIWPETFSDTTINVSLTVTTANGCVSTATESVTVYALPEDDIKGDMFIQENSKGITYEGPEASSYRWSVIEGDAVLVGATDGPTCLVDFLTQNSTLQLIVTNHVGCEDTLLQYIAMINLAQCNFYDKFSQVAYNNSHGTQDWTPDPWVEFNDDNNPSSGEVRVIGNRLRLENPNSGPTVYIERHVNLVNIDNAILAFDLWQENGIGNFDLFEVDIFDGSVWTTIYSLSGKKPGGFQPSFDISAYANENTIIRFKIPQGYRDNSKATRIDDVIIYGDCNLCGFEFVGLESEDTCEGLCEGVIFIDPDYPATGDFNLSYTYNGSVTNLGPYTTGDTVFITGLCAGTYSDITISRVDDQCSEIWPQPLTIGETGAEWEHVTHTDDVDNCDGDCNGSFTVDANHGLTGEFMVSYTFEGTITTLGPYNFAGDILINDLCSGVYSNITITGTETGCSDIWPTDIEIIIERPEATILSYENDFCQENMGEAIIQVSGGMAPYTIDWHSEDGTHSGTSTLNNAGQVTIDGLIGGHTYCFTVTDINGCSNN